MNNLNVKSITLTHVLCQKTEVIDRNSFVPRIIVVATHTLGFGASRRVNGLGLVKLRFHVTPWGCGYTVKTPLRVKYN